MPSASKKVVFAGILANIAIAAGKYVAAILTRSSAMMAEAFHSTADCGNELLLLLGMKRSQRPADQSHPYGHGKVLYFYSLLVAVYIFGIGGGLALYQGIAGLRKPEASSHPIWNFAVLAMSAAFDFYSWKVSYRELVAQKDPNESTWDEIVGSKNPVIFTVFLEDSAGLAGTALAFLGILLGHLFHNRMFDPIASILIGLLLMALALLLGRESGALLVGERTNRARIDRVRQLLREDPSVEGVGDVLTMQLGPEEVLLTVDIRFRRELDVQELESAIDRIESRIRREEPTIKRIFLEADSLKPSAGSRADRLTAESTTATRATEKAPNAQSVYGRDVMAKCEVCGNEYDKSFEVVVSGARHTFDSFECAIQALAPTCSHCSCRVIGHGVEISGQMFCCAHCANSAGRATGVRDRAA